MKILPALVLVVASAISIAQAQNPAFVTPPALAPRVVFWTSFNSTSTTL